MLRRIRNDVSRLLLRRIQDPIERHFTWLSGTLLGFSITGNFLLILYYVPTATTNIVVHFVLSLITPIIGIVSFIGGVITIQEWLSKKWPTRKSSRNSNSTDNDLSRPARGFVETVSERYERSMEQLEGWFTIRENEGIDLHPKKDSIDIDREAMLYVFVAQVASDAGERNSAKVNKQEIMDEIGFTSGSARVFISKMGDFIHRDFDPNNRQRLSETENDEIMFELNKKEALEGMKYIKEEKQAPN